MYYVSPESYKDGLDRLKKLTAQLIEDQFYVMEIKPTQYTREIKGTFKEDTMKEKIVVHCSTEELAEAVGEKIIGGLPKDFDFSVFREETCIAVEKEVNEPFNGWSEGPNYKSWFFGDNIKLKIITAETFLKEVKMEYNAEMQQALEKSIDKHQRIVDWLEQQPYNEMLIGTVVMEKIPVEVFGDNVPDCALCSHVGYPGCRNCILRENYGSCTDNGYLAPSDAASSIQYLEAEQTILEKLKNCRVEKPKDVVRDSNGNPVEVGKTYLFKESVYKYGWERVFKITKISRHYLYFGKDNVILSNGSAEKSTIRRGVSDGCINMTEWKTIMEIK